MANTGKLAGKVLFITGASRGIGRAIALKAAKDGAKVVVAAKTSKPHPKLPGTIYTVADEIIQAGGECLPCMVDIRYEEEVTKAVDQAVKAFGGIDILVNNASAISLTNTSSTPMKTFDLMMGINARGTYLCSKICLPHLRKSSHGHILNISPPLNMAAHWFRDHVAYTMAKYGMSMCVLGMSGELAADNIAVNALWPRTGIYTAAMKMLGGGDEIAAQCRKPEIMADAAYVILSHSAKDALPVSLESSSKQRVWTGQFFIDDEVLQSTGVTDMEQYACVPGSKLLPDFFLDVEPEKLVEILSGKTANVDAVGKTFESIKAAMNAEIVESVKASFVFEFSDQNGVKWFLDLKTGTGNLGKVTESVQENFDCTMTLSSGDFVDMFTGKLNPTQAFMNGKLKISGNMMAALKLEKLMKGMKAKL